MVVVVLVEIRVVGTEVSFLISPQHVIRPTEAGPSSPRTGVSWVVVNVSVAFWFNFLRGGVTNPTPNPPPLSGLGTGCWLRDLTGGVILKSWQV
jgi:hypothetical protein